jgi:hypothetical protein
VFLGNGYSLYRDFSASNIFQGGTNALVHTFMYYYYFRSACGFSNEKKYYITRIQIIQFIINIIGGTFIVLYEKTDEVIMGYIALMYSIYMLYFFVKIEINETKKRLKNKEKRINQ